MSASVLPLQKKEPHFRDRPGRRPCDEDEVAVMSKIIKKGVRITLRSIDGKQAAGPVAWSDLNNIAIVEDGIVRVFQKRNVIAWEYDLGALRDPAA